MKRRYWFTIAMLSLHATATLQGQTTTDSTQNIRWKQIGLGAAALAGAIALDGPVTQGIHGTISTGTLTLARQFDRFGDVTGLGPIIGGLALTGALTHDRFVTKTAVRALESVLLASVVTQVGKHVVGRVRPYGDPDLDATDFSFFKGDPAFPSGHSAAAFAMATTLGDAVNTPWARVGFYGLALGTGWARIVEEKHWLSDVVAGAALGFTSARFVSGRLRVFGLRAPHFIIGPQAVGVRWTF